MLQFFADFAVRTKSRHAECEMRLSPELRPYYSLQRFTTPPALKKGEKGKRIKIEKEEKKTERKKEGQGYEMVWK